MAAPAAVGDVPRRRGRRGIERILLGTGTLADAASPRDLLDRFVAAGGSRLDLANVYADGEALRIVGRWLAGRRATVGPTLDVKGCHRPFCRPELVRPEVERARAALGVESIDRFLLHRDDPGIPVEAWAEALRAELERETVGAVGASNWTPARFAALRAAFGPQAERVAVLSNHFSLAEMVRPPMPGCLAIDPDEARRLAAENFDVVAWAPLAGGFFSGRDHTSWESPSNRARRERVTRLAARRGVSPSAIALAYVLDGPDRLLAAIGTRSLPHLDELLAATAIALEPEEIGWLEGTSR